MSLGGGRENDPYFWVLWWNGLEIRIEESSERLEFTEDGKIVRKITQITVPKEALSLRDVIFALIKEAFYTQDKDKIITKIMCNHDLTNGDI